MDDKMLENLQTPELNKRLQAELQKDIPNAETVRQIIRVLEAREKDDPDKITPELQAVWDKYANKEPWRTDRRKPTARSWVIRAAVVTAACIVLLAVLPQSVQAETIWEKLARWTEAVFEFFDPTEKSEIHGDYVFQTDNPGLQEVYDAVVALGITDPVVPMWLPEGYELAECTTTETDALKSVYVRFILGSLEAIYKAEVYNKNVWHEYHKDVSEMMEYEVGGVVHQIMQNKGRYIVVWANDTEEYFLSISCKQDDVYAILDSIYTMGDE